MVRIWPFFLLMLSLLLLCGLLALRSEHVVLRASRADMDVVAGRHRYRSYVLGLKIHDAVRETSLSKVYREVIGDPPPPLWVFASSEEELLSGAWQAADGCVSAESAGNFMARQLDAFFTPDARKVVLTKFFGLLRDDARRAWEYAIQVSEFVVNSTKGQIGLNDLPPFMAEPKGP